MMLADAGADVVRLERAGAAAGLGSGSWNHTHRGRPSVGCDLKHPEGRELALRLAESADALIEGFRPGVMERLGLGPDELLERNPRLVYGRMTGWGQDGPLAQAAGHDINYISTAGVLGSFARQGERPLFPLNLVGDYGGGAMMLAFGVLAAILSARETGEGQVVDASMVEGSSLLATLIHAMRDLGMWTDEAGTEPARLRRALLRGLRDRRRRPLRGRRARAAVLRRAAAPARARPRGVPADGARALGRDEEDASPRSS